MRLREAEELSQGTQCHAGSWHANSTSAASEWWRRKPLGAPSRVPGRGWVLHNAHKALWLSSCFLLSHSLTSPNHLCCHRPPPPWLAVPAGLMHLGSPLGCSQLELRGASATSCHFSQRVCRDSLGNPGPSGICGGSGGQITDSQPGVTGWLRSLLLS